MNHSEIAPLSAYTLFRAGRDTLDISKILRIPEAEVVKQIDKERAEFKQWKTSFPKAKPKQRRRLLYIKTACLFGNDYRVSSSNTKNLTQRFCSKCKFSSNRSKTVMSTDKAMKMSSELVQFYAPTFGQENAIRLVGRKVAMSKWPLYRLIKGGVKDISADAYDRIKAAYLEHCAAQIARLQNEIEMVRSDDDFEDLAAEIAALAAEIKKRKERIK